MSLGEDEDADIFEFLQTYEDTLPISMDGVSVVDVYRFAEPLEEKDIDEKIRESVPKATVYKDTWAVNMFEQWRYERNARVACFLASEGNSKLVPSESLEKMTSGELNSTLALFISETRKANGEKYPPNTLHGIVAAIQHYLKFRGREFKFFNDPMFSKLMGSLDAAMKEASAEGLGSAKRQAEVISLEEEELLWSKAILGEQHPQQLLDTVIYLLGIHFALRGGKEHRRLRRMASQITSGIDGRTGWKYLEYREDVSKTNGGGLKDRKTAPKVTRAYENKKNPERCVVRLYEKYLSLCPEWKTGDVDALYLTPLKCPKQYCWYSSVPVGHNKLTSTVKKICEAAGLSGYRTNHSLRATAATRMFDKGLDEQLICEKTGHRSNAVRSYKRTSSEQEIVVSNILYGQPGECKKLKKDNTEDLVNIEKEKTTFEMESNKEQTKIEDLKGKININLNFYVK